MHRQKLLRLRSSVLNEMLDRGARVVWIKQIEDEVYDVVIETVKEPEFTRKQAVMEFVTSLNPSDLEMEMASREMDVQLGEAVMLYLARVAADGPA